MSFFLLPQVTHKLETNQKIPLELLCGKHKRHPDALGVDLLNDPGVDIVGDIYEVISAMPGSSVYGMFTCYKHLG